MAEGVDDAAFGLRRHVARLHREAGIEIKVVSTDDRRRGGRRALAGWANLRSSAPTNDQDAARRTMCRLAADVLSTSPKSPIASASDRDIGRGRHTRSTGVSTRRRRGRENSPSRPTIRGMTVVDRPTISEQFFGRFHAHGFPNT